MGDTAWARLPKLMADKTVGIAAASLAELLKSQDRGFAVVLHGGEPLLVGPKRLDRVLATLRQALDERCSLNIQTNGILITDRILDVCAKHNCSLSISLDGPGNVHDANRVGHRGQPTHDQVVKGIDTLRNHTSCQLLFSGLLAVVDPSSDAVGIYEYLKSFDAPSIDFLYRDGNRSRLPHGKATIESTEYGAWMCRLVDAYIADPNPTRIRILDDMFKLILGGHGEKEGVGLTDFGIIVIDTDGSITKNDTLKSSFDGADRFAENWSIHKNQLKDVVRTSMFAEGHRLQRPSSPICLSCPDLHICGGGMPLHRWSDDHKFDNPSVYCSDQKFLISHLRERVQEQLLVA